MRALTRGDVAALSFSAAATAGAAACQFADASRIATFVVTAVAIAALAGLVGRSTDRLGDRLGSGPTGFLQSVLANLPELFVGIFALRAGLIGVIQSALIGSILANILLVLGAAFIAGGLKHGKQQFSTETPRLILLLLVLAVAIIMIPTLSSHLGTGGAHHEVALSNVAAAVLLAVFLLSIPATLQNHDEGTERVAEGPLWPLQLVVIVLVAASIGSAFVSDWFVDALSPAMHSLHISQAFAGLVIVAIAGSAVENVVGVRLAMQNRPDYALSVVLQSPLQIAIGLIPVLVLVSNFVGPTVLTLVLPTMLFSVLALSLVTVVVVVFDGESTWLEGTALVGLYVMIATAFWWG